MIDAWTAGAHERSKQRDSHVKWLRDVAVVACRRGDYKLISYVSAYFETHRADRVLLELGVTTEEHEKWLEESRKQPRLIDRLLRRLR